MSHNGKYWLCVVQDLRCTRRKFPEGTADSEILIKQAISAMPKIFEKLSYPVTHNKEASLGVVPD